MVQHLIVKISYHCISCKREFSDMKSAGDHVKSTHHEITEELTIYQSDASQQMLNQINIKW
jgi:hypothetical protein